MGQPGVFLMSSLICVPSAGPPYGQLLASGLFRSHTAFTSSSICLKSDFSLGCSGAAGGMLPSEGFIGIEEPLGLISSLLLSDSDSDCGCFVDGFLALFVDLVLPTEPSTNVPSVFLFLSLAAFCRTVEMSEDCPLSRSMRIDIQVPCSVFAKNVESICGMLCG